MLWSFDKEFLNLLAQTGLGPSLPRVEKLDGELAGSWQAGQDMRRGVCQAFISEPAGGYGSW